MRVTRWREGQCFFHAQQLIPMNKIIIGLFIALSLENWQFRTFNNSLAFENFSNYQTANNARNADVRHSATWDDSLTRRIIVCAVCDCHTHERLHWRASLMFVCYSQLIIILHCCRAPAQQGHCTALCHQISRLRGAPHWVEVQAHQPSGSLAKSDLLRGNQAEAGSRVQSWSTI